jgi:nucleoside-diphosphate-sugar epimerase
MGKVLVTGSSGLIGTVLRRKLELSGRRVVGLDLRSPAEIVLDIRDMANRSDLPAISGVVHLAAISRVIHGEQNPELCESVNVAGTHAVIQAAANLPSRPWMIYASSREVYGESKRLPVAEDAELRPRNVYARSKVAAENLLLRAQADGLRACIVRFSNVYGSVHDHRDRVVPAFARAASIGGEIAVAGSNNTLDFTHVHDVARGVCLLIELLESPSSRPPPSIHFVSGRQTSLGNLAALAREIGEPGLRIVERPPRSFDVHNFQGDPSRAKALLGWQAETDLRTGFTQLMRDFKALNAEYVPGIERRAAANAR